MVTLIHGENTYFGWKKLQDLINDFPTIVFEGSDFDWARFQIEFESVPLFAEEKVIVIKNLLSLPKDKFGEKIFIYLQKQASNFSEKKLIFYEDKTLRKKKILDFLTKQGEVYYFPILKKMEIKKWVKQSFVDEDYKIAEEVVDWLLFALGEDPWVLAQEIAKIKLISGKETMISLPSVQDLSAVLSSGNIFALVDAIGNRQKKEALEVYLQMIQSGIVPQYIFAMIVRQYRLLLQMKELQENRLPFAEIQAKMKQAPFITTKLLSQCRHYELTELKSIYADLLEIDLQMKVGENPVRLLETLIFRICF